MNKTVLANLISKCVFQILEKPPEEAKNVTEEEQRQLMPYDNSYFFILFVMLFYSFLALTVFFGYMRSKKEVQRDQYEEFMEGKDQAKKWRASRPVEKFDFEEESIP
ncbi:hypothetical protein FKM82_024246 [Ascaphus truei]